MASRGLKWHHQDEIRQKIQTSQLINVLQAHALNIAGPNTPKKLTVTRLRAIEILLRKSIPDLSCVELNADVNGNVTITASKLDEKI